MWPFSSDKQANEPEPEPDPPTEEVEVEEEISRETELPVVKLRWDEGEDTLSVETVEGYSIQHRESGLAFREVVPRVRKWTWPACPLRSDPDAYIEFEYRDVRFVPYKHLLEWEIIDRETHEYTRTVTYTEEREVV